MTWWSWWMSGLGLAAVPIAHWLVLRRTLAVSGRYTALVNRVRHGAPEPEIDDAAALLEAIRAATQAEFGMNEAAMSAEPEDDADAGEPALPSLPTPAAKEHVLFLLGLMLGGLVSAALAGTLAPAFELSGSTFQAIFGDTGLPSLGALALGGVLVGFGTRMAGGCTSGHGLCGVSQLQTGSMAATAAFFGAGIVTSVLLGAVL